MLDEKKPIKKRGIRWSAVLWYIHVHVLGLYGLWLMFTSAKWMTIWFTLTITFISSLGLTAGAHRLWAHRAFAASTPLRLFLMLAHTLAGVGSIHDWVFYHRLHHKYYGTDKDLYNYKRGFLYSHFIGNCLAKDADYEQVKRDIDTRDLERDGIVWWQHKLYWPLFIIFGIILPLNAPLEYWDESLMETVIIAGFLRFAVTTHISWLIHSAIAVWTVKGDKYPPSDYSVFFVRKSFLPFYHYIIPCDWKSDEFGNYDSGFTTFFLKLWYELGMIDELRTTNTEDVRDVLHEMTNEKLTLQDGVHRLEEKVEYRVLQQKLMVRR